jgi:uncharacterized membrane protein YdjX (TVP38/TMEM64 family)
VFLFFLIPGLPDDVLCFVIGLSAQRLPPMLALALLGRLPGVWASCWVGAHAAALPWWAWPLVVLAAALLAWAYWRLGSRLERAVVRVISRRAERSRLAAPDAEPEASGDDRERQRR